MSSSTLHVQKKSCDQRAGAQEDHRAVAEDRRVAVGRTAPGTITVSQQRDIGKGQGRRSRRGPGENDAPCKPTWRTLDRKAWPIPATDLQTLVQNANALLVQKGRKQYD